MNKHREDRNFVVVGLKVRLVCKGVDACVCYVISQMSFNVIAAICAKEGN